MPKQQVQVNRDVLVQVLEALENTSPLGFNMESDKKFFAAITALRAALVDQPQTTHWQGCEEVHPECAAKSWDELEQQYQSGCTHCTHPQYVGIRCNVCGRWTENQP